MNKTPTHRQRHPQRRPRAGMWTILALIGPLRLGGAAAEAQTCFFYVDNEDTLAPFDCVEQGDLTTPCSWDGDCHEDGDPSDCCTSVPAAGPMTNLLMHTQWHLCFGSVGDGDGNNPPTRGQRWYAFHRQYEVDFNRWRDGIGFGHIESLEWCPNMNMPHGHPSAAPGGIGHVSGCGNGTPRPDDVTCVNCQAFPQCLFFGGAGPMACPSAPSTNCQGVGVSFPYTTLEEFANVEEISTILDDYYHGTMHGAVGFADGSGYIGDVTNPVCSPRDPMFWRLHKALDDVVRAWQDAKAVDVMIVVDRSGSMSDLDSGGMTKLDAALEAVDMFADLLEHDRADGQVNRVGVVSYSSGATLQMPLTVADATLRDPGGPLDTALTAIQAAGAAGCTSIGAGIERALEELCPPGDCQGFAAGGDNDRKGLLVLTDGLENRPPCLQPIDPTPGGPCGSTCRGDQLDFDKLEFTQLVAVGFGDSGSLNGDLLTLVAERQGGIYMQNPDTPGNDLKDFFVKAFGNLTDEFLLFDPKGFLPAGDLATPPVEYTSCGDTKLTFASGWRTPVSPGDLRLLVTSPSGDLVMPGDPGVQASTEPTWDYARVRLPYRGDSKGTWRAQLVRRHRTFVNGFTTDSFINPDQGMALVRRQIQRLCPNGCEKVLYYEDGRFGPRSAYEDALEKEVGSGLLGEVTRATSANDFAVKLQGVLAPPVWDLIVYARQRGPDQAEPYDAELRRRLCQNQRAIITDTRLDSGFATLICAGAQWDQRVNWKLMTGNGQLFDGSIPLTNPGYNIFSYGLLPTGNEPGGTEASQIQATTDSTPNGAIVARGARGTGQYWFIDVLGRGLHKLDPHLFQSIWKAEDGLIATVRMLPSYIRAGGYDNVNARVEVTYPLVGLGCLLQEVGLRDEMPINGEILDRRAATVADINIPTATEVFPMFDDGTNGDEEPGNAYWTARLPGIGHVDGMYKFRFMLDFDADGCGTHRELVQSVFVDLAADPASSGVQIGPTTSLPDGRFLTPVRIRPFDRLGNCWGPGRPGLPSCGPPGECDLDRLRQSVVDHNDGSYTLNLVTAPDVAGVRVDAFGGSFDLPLPCDVCPDLASLSLAPDRVREHGSAVGKIGLDGPAPVAGVGGALVYLSSSNPAAAAVPTSIIVPAGMQSATFPITVYHAHGGHGGDDEEEQVVISALYGDSTSNAILTVVPIVPIPGDCDNDGDVDVDDLERFEACAAGPAVPIPPDCVCEDLDGDNDGDVVDFGIFQRCITGSNVIGDPHCAD